LDRRTAVDIDLREKVAVVTGAGKGIGRETALELARRGAAVACVDVKPQLAQETAALVTGLDRKALAYSCNVADTNQVNSTVETILKDLGRIDILVNNAGITRDNLLMRISDEEWDAVLDVNLKGAFNFTRAAARTMVKQRSGKIVNIASIVGITGNPGQANYSASKAGVIGLTKTAALELASRGINVNAVAPGFIETDMTGILPDKVKTEITARIPLGKMGKPSDVAAAVLFLSSPLADYVTGHVLVVAGGLGA
jgi:3-oxoacyl-[acyl-carrier protein] reductase